VPILTIDFPALDDHRSLISTQTMALYTNHYNNIALDRSSHESWHEHRTRQILAQIMPLDTNYRNDRTLFSQFSATSSEATTIPISDDGSIAEG